MRPPIGTALAVLRELAERWDQLRGVYEDYSVSVWAVLGDESLSPADAASRLIFLLLSFEAQCEGLFRADELPPPETTSRIVV